MSNKLLLHKDVSSKKEILYVSFNQDCSCIGVGHDDGYMFYSFQDIDNLHLVQEGKPPEIPERVCIVERFFRSSLVTLVSMKQTRKLWVYHSQNNNEICANTFGSAILAVKMNRKRIVVCLEDMVSIHNVRDMRQLHKITDTPLNLKGIMDLSNDEQNACYLAIPGASSTGHVIIFDTDALVTACSFSAHASPLAAMRFNADGTMLATASEKGTVIRVFAIPVGERLFEFTRGVKRCVTISSLAFSADSKYLCLSSNTETVHIFALKKTEVTLEKNCQEESSVQEGIGSWVNYFSQQASAYLPTHMNELMLREKSVATARLPIVGTKTSVAMTRIDNVDYLLVASKEGYLFCYTVDIDSGECALIRQHRISPNALEEDEIDQINPVVNVRTKTNSLPPNNGESTSALTIKQFQNTLDNKKLLCESEKNLSLFGNKPAPPPIPPAPKKRSDSAHLRQQKTKSNNSFDFDDNFLFNENSDQTIKNQNLQSKNKKSEKLKLPADLNDMDEFPPLAAL